MKFTYHYKTTKVNSFTTVACVCNMCLLPNKNRNVKERTIRCAVYLNCKMIRGGREWNCEIWLTNETYTYHLQGDSTRALQWYSKCYYVETVTKTFTLKSVQTIHYWRCWTMDSLCAFKWKCFRNTHHAVTFEIPSQSFFETPFIAITTFVLFLANLQSTLQMEQ
jgi:hypothetical protein